MDKVERLLYFLAGTHHLIDRAAFWTMVSGVAALIAVLVAWRQLSGLKKISNADFTQRFTKEFFTADTRELLTLLMNSALQFDVQEIKDKCGNVIDGLPYLKIRKEIRDQIIHTGTFNKER